MGEPLLVRLKSMAEMLSPMSPAEQPTDVLAEAELARWAAVLASDKAARACLNEMTDDEVAALLRRLVAMARRAREAAWFPNGWPQPTFMTVDDDGALHIEWCFGAQGSPESYRIGFMWDPKEGAMACKTMRGEQPHDLTTTAARSLARWLDEARKP